MTGVLRRILVWSVPTQSLFTYFFPLYRPANPVDPPSAPPPPVESSIPDPDRLLPKPPSSRKTQRKKYKKASYSLQPTPRSLDSMLFCCFPAVFSNPPSQRAKTDLHVCVRFSSPPPVVRQRHRVTSSLARKKADKDKRSKDVYRRLSVGK